MRRALQQNLEPKLKNKKPTSSAMIPFHHTLSNKISGLLKKHNIRRIHIPKRKTAQMLRSAKDGLELKVPGVYRIPCGCRKLHVGQRKDYRGEVQRTPEIHKSHCIDFSDTSVLGRTSGFVDRLVKGN
jgi:hypothetical protein